MADQLRDALSDLAVAVAVPADLELFLLFATRKETCIC